MCYHSTNVNSSTNVSLWLDLRKLISGEDSPMNSLSEGPQLRKVQRYMLLFGVSLFCPDFFVHHESRLRTSNLKVPETSTVLMGSEYWLELL